MPLYSNEPVVFEHLCEERTFDHPLYPISKPREEGFLQVSDIHKIFYALYGNPEGIPVVVLHGGPGAGCSDAMVGPFDLTRWNVIMFDQRGSMRSEPFGCLEENTPQDSIRDMEALREHLSVNKWMIYGGSWGSTLSILYGQAYPDNCLGFILRGVCLCREHDYLHLFYGMGKIFPEAYEAVVNYIPAEERDDLFSAYCRRMNDPDPSVQLNAARTFMKFDAICSTAQPNRAFVENMMQNDRLMLGVVKIFCHYGQNKFFLEPNQILSNLSQISHVPCLMVQGRWDAICPPHMAYLLHKHWDNSQLWIVSDGGHTAGEPPLGRALATATELFSKNLTFN